MTKLACFIKSSVAQLLGGAIDELSRSSKVIDKRLIINFREKNVVIARFCNKTTFFIFMPKCQDISWYIMICHDLYENSYSPLSIAIHTL